MRAFKLVFWVIPDVQSIAQVAEQWLANREGLRSVPRDKSKGVPYWWSLIRVKLESRASLLFGRKIPLMNCSPTVYLWVVWKWPHQLRSRIESKLCGNAHWVFDILKSAKPPSLLDQISSSDRLVDASDHVYEVSTKRLFCHASCLMPLSRLRRIESIITHERQNHTVIDSIRQFDRALLPCCSWWSVRAFKLVFWVIPDVQSIAQVAEQWLAIREGLRSVPRDKSKGVPYWWSLIRVKLESRASLLFGQEISLMNCLLTVYLWVVWKWPHQLRSRIGSKLCGNAHWVFDILKSAKPPSLLDQISSSDRLVDASDHVYEVSTMRSFLSCFCLMQLSRLRRIESIITHEPTKPHSYWYTIRQFDRVLVAMLLMMISVCIRVGFLSHSGRAVYSSSGSAVTSNL